MLKNSKRYKLKKKSKNLEITNSMPKKKVLCDYTIGKYKKKMCYRQKKNSWIKLLKFVN